MDHLSETQVVAFTDGTVGTKEALRIAEHLDQCGECHSRVTAADPMRAAFTASFDSNCPPGLIEAISLQDSTSEPYPWAETIVGGLLLCCALGWAAFTVDPYALVNETALGFVVYAKVGMALVSDLSPSMALYLSAAGLLVVIASILAQPLLGTVRAKT